MTSSSQMYLCYISKTLLTSMGLHWYNRREFVPLKDTQACAKWVIWGARIPLAHADAVLRYVLHSQSPVCTHFTAAT